MLFGRRGKRGRMIRLEGSSFVVICHNCHDELRVRSDADATLAGWLTPYHVRQSGGWLQTQLCPKCSWWSFRRWLKIHGRRLRWLNQLYASLNNYFWLPCPLCSDHFGGHELSGNLYLGNGRGQGVCFDCADHAEELSAEVYQRETSMVKLQ